MGNAHSHLWRFGHSSSDMYVTRSSTFSVLAMLPKSPIPSFAFSLLASVAFAPFRSPFSRASDHLDTRRYHLFPPVPPTSRKLVVISKLQVCNRTYYAPKPKLIDSKLVRQGLWFQLTVRPVTRVWAIAYHVDHCTVSHKRSSKARIRLRKKWFCRRSYIRFHIPHSGHEKSGL